jgi:hypothetical protein
MPPSRSLAELRLDGPTVDILLVLLVSFAIREDRSAQRYSLQKFNSSFFAWTILLVVFRHGVLWGKTSSAISENIRCGMEDGRLFDELARGAWPDAFLRSKRPDEVVRDLLLSEFQTVATDHVDTLWRTTEKTMLEALCDWDARQEIEAVIADTIGHSLDDMVNGRLWEDQSLKRDNESLWKRVSWALSDQLRPKLMRGLALQLWRLPLPPRSTERLAQRLAESLIQWVTSGLVEHLIPPLWENGFRVEGACRAYLNASVSDLFK